MKRIEIRPGLFVYPIKKPDWIDKLASTKGEDKEMLLSLNKFRDLGDAICNHFLINKQALLEMIKKEMPDYDPENDLIYIEIEEI